MMMLLAFDLPRFTKEERRQAAKYQKRLVELGFFRKQFSLYEREVRTMSTRDNLIDILRSELPDAGSIVLYMLPDEVNNKQINILGKEAKKTIGEPQMIIL